jgi:hypothetical protein
MPAFLLQAGDFTLEFRVLAIGLVYKRPQTVFYRDCLHSSASTTKVTPFIENMHESGLSTISWQILGARNQKWFRDFLKSSNVERTSFFEHAEAWFTGESLCLESFDSWSDEIVQPS